MDNEKTNNNKYLKVDINELRTTAVELKKHNDNINETLLLIGKTFTDLEESFNTKTGKLYQEIMTKYLSDTINFISSKNGYLVNKLNEINNVYSELFMEVENTVKNTVEDET